MLASQEVLCRNWYSLVDVATRLRAEGSGARKIVRDRRFVSSPKRPDQLRAHLAPCSMNTMVLFTGINGTEREIDQSRPLVPKLRMNGAVPFLPHCVLMTMRGKTLIFRS